MNKLLIWLLLCLFACSLINADPPWSVEAHSKIKEFGKQLTKKNQMIFLNSGCGVFCDAKRVSWDLNIMSTKKWTLEQARPVVVSMIEDFLNLVYKDPIFAYSITQLNKKMPLTYPPDLAPDRIAMKITFWDENMDRPLYPHIAQIRVMEGRVDYYYTGPDNKTLQTPPHSETYEESFSKAGKIFQIPNVKLQVLE